ncbi:hypothetical protein CCY99_07595 [Helicobacter sp. 16-1353]|uniref:pimelyl-ACP methyl ester esterase BioV n=1 Tax=Helicobacter sp. 16-1353 TaxID=2004996 RepID=UPI000DCBE0C4|nr:pimelyl-ACP methyl ester esterase BioV [Helicobacter sp. 16-1353]RAX52246.1 hypothetical protein CCY99_07595 [Helicobacter sp. 16-1353]
MIFFGGFGFNDDYRLFSDILEAYNFLDSSDYRIYGFSFGAQKAIDYALDSKNRINDIILLSPAFFNNKNDTFRESQLLHFKKNKNIYMKYFLQNIGFDKSMNEFLKEPSFDDLESLLYYHFNKESLRKLQDKGILIITFLGELDRIIDSSIALDFFKEFGIVYFLKNTNHLLRKVK